MTQKLWWASKINTDSLQNDLQMHLGAKPSFTRSESGDTSAANASVSHQQSTANSRSAQRKHNKHTGTKKHNLNEAFEALTAHDLRIFLNDKPHHWSCETSVIQHTESWLSARETDMARTLLAVSYRSGRMIQSNTKQMINMCPADRPPTSSTWWY